MLGVSNRALLTHERHGRIVVSWIVQADAMGRLRQTPVYPLDGVLKLPRKDPHPTPENPDELTARAFELFEQGKSLREVIILLRATKDKIEKLHEDWLDVGGAAMILSDANRKALEAKFGPLESAEDLVAKACR